MNQRFSLAFGIRFLLMGLFVACAFPARAGMTSYTVITEDGQTLLTSVSVERGGGPVVFDADKLIGVNLIHFKSPTTGIAVVPSGHAAPAEGQRSSLLDTRLNSGLINPGGPGKALTASPVLAGPEAAPGMAVRFAEPVVNLAGDDVVLFELQREERSPLAGDPVIVAPLELREGLKVLSITEYDIQYRNPKAVDLDAFDAMAVPKPVDSVEALEASPLSATGMNQGFKALAVAIDLSELGYGEGEKVAGLFFQNAGTGGPCVDPVCIAGLPLPEPGNVLAEEPKTPRWPGAHTLEEMLEGPMADVDEIVFTVRVPGSDHWYANFGYYSSPEREYPPEHTPGDPVELPAIFKNGGRLCRMNIRTGEMKVLLDDPEGAVRDPQVHYDGEKIVFSYRRGGDPYYHLHEMKLDGSGLRQVTDGPHNDIEPTYLPDGGIMFCSDRCNRFVNCWVTPVAILYRCEADGSNLHAISTNIEHDNTPWPLPDGRVIYMRWEYVDRSQSHFHHLWTANPDGTAQMVYYGNQHPGVAMLDAKPIPGTNKVVASFSPGHGRPEHAGYVTVVNPESGPDAQKNAKRISKEGPVYRDPYPFAEDCFLVAREGQILVMDGVGSSYSIYALPESDKGRFCHEPRPIVKRSPELTIPPRTNPEQGTGRLVLTDIYEGRNMEGVERGEVKELLVLEVLPKPVNFSGGMWPTSAGGTFSLSRVLGTVPVEPDGSAYIEAPAMRSLYFVALDKDGLSVKRMQSFLSLMPGETTSCVGCHESRTETPLSQSSRLLAMQRPPSPIAPVEHVPGVIDYARDVQPVFDKHCTKCHNPDKYAGRVDMTGDHSPLFCQSYWTITHHGLVADGRNEHYGNRAPRTIGSSASPLMKKICGGHKGVSVPPKERDVVRLWIEASAPYAGTYAALGSGMFPVEFPADVMEERCGACHASDPPAKRPIGEHKYFRFGKKGLALPLVHTFMELRNIRAYMGYYKSGNARPPQSLCNLTRPEKSILLRAPLSKDAGGLELCGPGVFADTNDEAYLAILGAIRVAAAKQEREKRFDMAGFRPNDYYIYQMQRYGILPSDLKPTDPVNPFATDQAYWASFWYTPESLVAAK